MVRMRGGRGGRGGASNPSSPDIQGSSDDGNGGPAQNASTPSQGNFIAGQLSANPANANIQLSSQDIATNQPTPTTQTMTLEVKLMGLSYRTSLSVPLEVSFAEFKKLVQESQYTTRNTTPAGFLGLPDGSEVRIMRAWHHCKDTVTGKRSLAVHDITENNFGEVMVALRRAESLIRLEVHLSGIHQS